MASSAPAASAPAAPPASLPAPADTHCDLYASPNGSDSGDGSQAAPFGSVVKLDTSLAPGQTGCLMGGTYGGIHTKDELTSNGAAGSQITITSAPGQVATVRGWVDLEGSYTTLRYLEIDGSNDFYTQERSGTSCPYPVSQGLVIAGHDDVFEHNNFYQSVASLRGNGIGVGWWGHADNVVIRYDKIHDVGQCLQYDHLIYLASGNNAQIYGNWMWNDAHGNGVSLYPAPTNARVYANVIANAGTGFSISDDGGSNAGNQLYHNVVVGSTGISGQVSFLAPVMVRSAGLGATSLGNKVYDNDSFQNPGGASEIDRSIGSQDLTVTGTLLSDPEFVDAANHDYDVQAGSPASSWGLWNGD